MSNILAHVKYKNSSTQASTNTNTDSKQKKLVLVKKQTVQTVRSGTEVVSERPEVCGSKQEKTNGSRVVPTTKPKRATKGANPNKDIIKRSNKGFNRTFKSLEELGDLLPDDTQ